MGDTPVAGAIGKGVQKEYLDKQIATHRDYLEQHLNKSTWFVGNEFSAADIQMSFPVEALAGRGGLDGCRNCKAICNAFTRVLRISGLWNRVGRLAYWVEGLNYTR